MKKLTIIFAFIIFASTTSFAQFSYTRFGDRSVSNTNKPFEIIDLGDQSPNSKYLVRIQEYYLEWNENHLKIQKVGYLEDGELISLEEQFLNYSDVKKQDKIEKTSVGANNKSKYQITLDSNKLPTIYYDEKIYLKSHKSSLTLPFADDKAFFAFIGKIQDKAFDLALDLDKETARVDFEDEVENNNSKSKTSESSASTESSADEEETSSDSGSSASDSSSNSTPQAKTEVTVEIKNKSNNLLEIYYKDNPKNSSKTSTSINARSSKRISIKVGSVVYSAGGQKLLRITADMDGTEQIIAK